MCACAVDSVIGGLYPHNVNKLRPNGSFLTCMRNCIYLHKLVNYWYIALQLLVLYADYSVTMPFYHRWTMLAWLVVAVFFSVSGMLSLAPSCTRTTRPTSPISSWKSWRYVNVVVPLHNAFPSWALVVTAFWHLVNCCVIGIINIIIDVNSSASFLHLSNTSLVAR